MVAVSCGIFGTQSRPESYIAKYFSSPFNLGGGGEAAASLFLTASSPEVTKTPVLLLATAMVCQFTAASETGIVNTRVYPKAPGLAAWSENCKWYSFLPLDTVLSLFYESV
jgi:hypothetical protein